MGEVRWYLRWLLLGLLIVCLSILAIRYATLLKRVPLTDSAPMLNSTAQAKSGSQKEYHPASRTGKNSSGEQARPVSDSSAANAGSGQESGNRRGQPITTRTPPATQGKLNINSASLAELIALPGIGPALAQRIVDYRREHGAFKRVEDLDDVKGIGPAKIKQIKDLVTVKAQGG